MSPARVFQVGLASIVYAMALGVAAGWWLHETLQPSPAALGASSVDLPIATTDVDRPPNVEPPPVPTGDAAMAPDEDQPVLTSDPIAELRRHSLRVPIEGANVDDMKDGFAQRRNGNRRAHEAVDLLAPRGTPVRAVEDGTIARLFSSRNGGLTIYQFDPTRRFCYYYAHLDAYARGIAEGDTVSAGDVIGYVGTTGNAAPDTPHLHFAIFELTPGGRWWEGSPLDPYLVFAERAAQD